MSKEILGENQEAREVGKPSLDCPGKVPETEAPRPDIATLQGSAMQH